MNIFVTPALSTHGPAPPYQMDTHNRDIEKDVVVSTPFNTIVVAKCYFISSTTQIVLLPSAPVI